MRPSSVRQPSAPVTPDVTMSVWIQRLDTSVGVIQDTDPVKMTSTDVQTLMSAWVDPAHRYIIVKPESKS